MDLDHSFETNCIMISHHLRKHLQNSKHLFDELAAVQDKKQINVLIRYWNKIERLTVTQYLMSFFFERATGEYIADLYQVYSIFDLFIVNQLVIW